MARHLRFLSATLPSKIIGEDDAKKRFAVYHRLLSSYSNDALAYMTRRACETLDWFPTPRQCLAILEEYPTPTSPKTLALAYCERFWQEKLEAFLSSLRDGTATQADVDAVPEQWRRIGMERGSLCMLEDGSFSIRPPAQIGDGDFSD